VDIAVKEAMDTYGSDCEITLVGHSIGRHKEHPYNLMNYYYCTVISHTYIWLIGGWIARAWLSEWASPTLKSQYVLALYTDLSHTNVWNCFVESQVWCLWDLLINPLQRGLSSAPLIKHEGCCLISIQTSQVMMIVVL
jgi:hypothetical protein